ncbi:MAG: hypothetical protein ACR2IF_12485 [Terriglobales bacterium]
MAEQLKLDEPARVKRFELELPLRYRYMGGFQWFRGTTHNVSCTGILFSGPVKMEMFSPVEIRLPVPKEITGDAVATMLCGGFIARIIEPDGPMKEPQLGAAFLNYQLLSTNGKRRLNLGGAPAHDDIMDKFVHEFRNLLEIIIGHSDLLLMHEDLQPMVRSSAVRIREAGERAAALTKALGG